MGGKRVQRRRFFCRACGHIGKICETWTDIREQVKGGIAGGIARGVLIDVAGRRIWDSVGSRQSQGDGVQHGPWEQSSADIPSSSTGVKASPQSHPTLSLLAT